MICNLRDNYYTSQTKYNYICSTILLYSSKGRPLYHASVSESSFSSRSTSCNNTGSWDFLNMSSSKSRSRRIETRGNDPTSSLEQAVFSIVVQISYDNCWLTPCGHWKGPNQVTKKFEDLKLSFQGERPSHEVFAEDFTTSVSNIRKLIDQQIATTDSDPNAIQLDSSYPHVQMAPTYWSSGMQYLRLVVISLLQVFQNVTDLPNSQKTDGNASDTASDSEVDGAYQYLST